MKPNYQPPYTITLTTVNLVAEIGETIGRYTVLAEQNLTPRLHRENRIRTIQTSLAIENNTLTCEQMTAVIEGRRVLGHLREIQEMRDAFATYEAMEDWDVSAEEELLAAHELLLRGLVDETGRYQMWRKQPRQSQPESRVESGNSGYSLFFLCEVSEDDKKTEKR